MGKSPFSSAVFWAGDMLHIDFVMYIYIYVDTYICAYMYFIYAHISKYLESELPVVSSKIVSYYLGEPQYLLKY